MGSTALTLPAAQLQRADVCGRWMGMLCRWSGAQQCGPWGSRLPAVLPPPTHHPTADHTLLPHTHSACTPLPSPAWSPLSTLLRRGEVGRGGVSRVRLPTRYGWQPSHARAARVVRRTRKGACCHRVWQPLRSAAPATMLGEGACRGRSSRDAPHMAQNSKGRTRQTNEHERTHFARRAAIHSPRTDDSEGNAQSGHQQEAHRSDSHGEARAAHSAGALRRRLAATSGRGPLVQE